MRTTVLGPTKDGWRIDKLSLSNFKGHIFTRYEVLCENHKTIYKLSFVNAKRALARVRRSSHGK